jgi:hypothetical protein
VILRVIRGRASPDELAALRLALNGRLGSANRDRTGPARVHLGSRPAQRRIGSDPNELDAVLIALWDSIESSALGDAEASSPRTLARQHLRDTAIEHFEIDESFMRRSSGQPIAIRLATGRFSKPGADRQMQELLRQRAPLIGDEMTEAYVARRLVGGAVEVTFVSAWSRPPADRPLEEAFWPDIALRYDEFRVEVYATLGVQ